MRLLTRRRCPEPRAKSFRSAEPYLLEGCREARRLGHGFVGTEHVLLVLLRHADGGATRVLRDLGVAPERAEETLRPCIGGGAPKIDPEALAAIGVDLDAVRARLEETFGPGALEQARASCLGVMPRLKMALAHAVDYAGDGPVRDEHVLLGMLSVPDSLGARVLRGHGVSLESAKAKVERAA
jgi:ATP-dependent Clp protease ATP-binding subunit ClpA